MVFFRVRVIATGIIVIADIVERHGIIPGFSSDQLRANGERLQVERFRLLVFALIFIKDGQIINTAGIGQVYRPQVGT